MQIKLTCHLMPWEIDYALLTFTQLKKSKYYLSDDVNITIETVLNLSSYVIDWDNSKLPKEYFIEKYNTLSLLLNDYNHIKHIYDGDELYGHLDLQRECISEETDYYMGICPDIYFTEHTLHYLVEGTRAIKDKYFVLSPQHRKLSDASWDISTDPDFLNLPYSDCDKVDLYDMRAHIKTRDVEIYPELNPQAKFAGWFDIYSKAFYEDLFPIQDDWKGYGPWDLYCLILSQYLKQAGINYNHYILRGQTTGEYWTGNFMNINGYTGYYKNLLTLKDIPNQRQIFESNLNQYIEKGLLTLKEKGII
jgi:hypothetical protein